MPPTGQYEPMALIARGGMCEIWLGVLEGAAGFRKPVVLKRAFARASEGLEEARQALVDEAHVSAALNHPNVIHVYELIDAPEGLLLAMEYLPGLSLRTVLRQREGDSFAPLPWPIAARVGADAARGLEHAHGATSPSGGPLRCIHRDVSPHNLVVTEGGTTKVVDFGIARSTLRDATQGFVVKGKLAYMSPEQLRAEPLESSTDVFSLGVVLHEALSGERLFWRSTEGRTMEAVLTAQVPDLDESINAVVRDVVRRMIVRDVARRTITMREVADALEAAAAGQGGTHNAVASLLSAEHGPKLERRRKRLEELLSRPSFHGLPTEEDESSTIAAVETILDAAPTREIRGTSGAGAGEADTEVDGPLSETFVERPLLPKKP